MSAIGSYTKIYALGHRYLQHLFDDPVVVEEKVDGSQFSFGIIDGVLRFRSRSQGLDPEHPEKMFATGIEAIRQIGHLLRPGWIYRGEYLQKPKHNTLAYARIPLRHTIIWDIETAEQHYLTPEQKSEEAARLGMETVPVIAHQRFNNAGQLKEMLQCTSWLGGVSIEGIVVKNYNQYGPDKKILAGKHVSEAFKEVHSGEWRKANPTKGDILDELTERYRTAPRWEKAVYHLRDSGQLQHSPADIGNLMKHVRQDIEAECADEIKERLYAWARDKLLRGCVRGLPEWYKNRLLESQFNG